MFQIGKILTEHIYTNTTHNWGRMYKKGKRNVCDRFNNERGFIFLTAWLVTTWANSPRTLRSFGMTEDTVVGVAIILIVLVGVGIVMMFFGWAQKKNKDSVDSLVNATKQKYCSTCKINVSEECTHCPVCGRPLQNEGGNQNGPYNT